MFPVELARCTSRLRIARGMQILAGSHDSAIHPADPSRKPTQLRLRSRKQPATFAAKTRIGSMRSLSLFFLRVKPISQREVPLVVAEFSAIESKTAQQEIVSTERGLYVCIYKTANPVIAQASSKILLAEQDFETERFAQISRERSSFV